MIFINSTLIFSLYPLSKIKAISTLPPHLGSCCCHFQRNKISCLKKDNFWSQKRKKYHFSLYRNGIVFMAYYKTNILGPHYLFICGNILSYKGIPGKKTYSSMSTQGWLWKDVKYVQLFLSHGQFFAICWPKWKEEPKFLCFFTHFVATGGLR